MEASKLLPESIKNKIADPDNRIFVSVASIWEIAIKRNLKKIRVNFDIETSIKKADIQTLPIEIAHALETEKLPQYHRDPFDRILIAQAKVENLTLITNDSKIKKYTAKILSWPSNT